MNSPDLDPLDEALRCLARDDALELPDASLNERLLRAANARAKLSSRVRPRRSAWSRAAVLAFVIGASGLAIGSTVGFERIRAWWYSIVIDGQEVNGTLDGDGTRQVDYLTHDGYRVSVRVGRRELDGHSVQTSIDVSEVGEHTIERTFEEVVMPAPGAVLPEPARFSRVALEDAEMLHSWTDGGGVRWSVWLGPDPDGPGARLLVEDVDSREPMPVRMALRTARTIGAGGHVSIRELSGGILDVSLSDGRGWEIAILVAGSDGEGLTGPGEFSTPSGRVQIRVGD